MYTYGFLFVLAEQVSGGSHSFDVYSICMVLGTIIESSNFGACSVSLLARVSTCVIFDLTPLIIYFDQAATGALPV